MKTKEFYKRLSKEIYEHTHPSNQHLVKDLQITSLHQVLGIFRSIMIRNNMQQEDAIQMEKDLKSLMNVIGIDRGDIK